MERRVLGQDFVKGRCPVRGRAQVLEDRAQGPAGPAVASTRAPRLLNRRNWVKYSNFDSGAFGAKWTTGPSRRSASNAFALRTE